MRAENEVSVNNISVLKCLHNQLGEFCTPRPGMSLTTIGLILAIREIFVSVYKSSTT